jgi:hypothetical protein
MAGEQKPPVHLMLDLETLGTAPGCALLSIGAVIFDPVGRTLGAEFYANIEPITCAEAGLWTDSKTVEWWESQSPEARAGLEQNRQALHLSLALFGDFYVDSGATHLWCHGPNFDEPILGAAYRASHMAVPWKYNAARCTRTIYELAGVGLDRATGVHHHALDDAKAQAEAAIRALGLLAMARQA